MPTGNDQVAELETQVTTLETQVADLTKKLQTATEDGGDDVAKAVEMQGQVNDLTKQLEDLTKTLETVTSALEEATLQNEAVTKLSPAQREVFDAIEKKEDKESFLEMTEDDREKEVKKRAAADDTVVINGRTIRKSVVGEDAFVVMKSQADEIAKNAKDLGIEKAAREQAVMEKAADDKYPHVPGTTAERAQMLGAIAKMDEPLQKAFTKVFEQSEKLGKAGFDTLGHGGGKGPDKDKISKATTDFESKAAEIKKRDSCTKEQAFTKARKEHPALFDAYQKAGAEEGAATQ